MVIPSLLPTTTATAAAIAAIKHPPHHRQRNDGKHKDHAQQQNHYYEEEQQRVRTKKNKRKKRSPPPKPPSSWEQFKNLFNCKSVVPSQVHKASFSSSPLININTTTTNGKLGSSCSSICSIKDVVHNNTRVVHRGDHDRSPESSGNLGLDTSLLNTGSSARSAATRHHQSSSRGMQLRKLSGCYECHAISDSTRYPMPRTICSCPECGEMLTKPEGLELHQTIRHAVTELGSEDSGRNIVEIIFKSSWVKKDMIIDHNHMLNHPTFFRIDRILKVHNTQRTVSRFEDYRDAVKSRASLLLLHNTTAIPANKSGKKNPRCAADGNELLRFHCTALSCSLGAQGSMSLCCGHSSQSSTPPCGVCSIIRHGFGRAKQEPGKGVRTTASSGRAHECFRSATGEDAGKRRAMLVCRVIAGRVRRAGDEVTVMEEDGVGVGVGYDSVASGGGKGYGNLEELFVTNPRAILPCFVVVYRTLN